MVQTAELNSAAALSVVKETHCSFVTENQIDKNSADTRIGSIGVVWQLIRTRAPRGVLELYWSLFVEKLSPSAFP